MNWNEFSLSAIIEWKHESVGAKLSRTCLGIPAMVWARHTLRHLSMVRRSVEVNILHTGTVCVPVYRFVYRFCYAKPPVTGTDRPCQWDRPDLVLHLLCGLKRLKLVFRNVFAICGHCGVLVVKGPRKRWHGKFFLFTRRVSSVNLPTL